jgi:zinc transporter 1/2/3
MEEATITAILKIVFMILFFIIVCFVGTLPIRSKAFKTNPKYRIIGSTFAGALFINVAILHILSESADTLEEYLKDGEDI